MDFCFCIITQKNNQIFKKCFRVPPRANYLCNYLYVKIEALLLPVKVITEKNKKINVKLIHSSLRSEFKKWNVYK